MGQNNSGGTSCKTMCWLGALIAGVLVAALLMGVRDSSFLSAVFWGLVVLLVGGFALNWAFCGKAEAEASSAPSAAPSETATAAAPLATSGAVTTASPVAENAGAAAATLSEKPAAASDAPKVKPSAALAGEADVASRKGEWKYEAEPKKTAAKKPVAKKPAAKKAATAKAAPKAEVAETKPATKAKAAPKAAAAKAKPVAADGKPELLKKARAGGPDDLKQIKGVGPKLEGVLHSMGVFHFDQVASWRKKEVEWADNNIEGIKGRASRDEWVKQAKVLAKGGETEFSKKVKKGGVY